MTTTFHEEASIIGPEVLISGMCLLLSLYILDEDVERIDRGMRSLQQLLGVNGSHTVLLSQRPLRRDGKYLFTIT